MFLNQSGRGTLSLLGEPAKSARQPRSSFVPRLDLLQAHRWGNLRENVSVFFTGPAPLRKFPGFLYFRECTLSAPLPDRALLASALWHVVFVLLLVQIWPLLPSPPRVERPQVE